MDRTTALASISLGLMICLRGAPTSDAGRQAVQSGQQLSKPTLYYIPHTHWEGAVFLTREEYLQDGLDHIIEALRLLDKYPDYKFALDQVAYFKPFLERYPELAAKFKKYVVQGRLEIVGGMDVMPDDVKVPGELFIRGMTYAKDYCRKELGLDVDVAWMLDTFGHHPQMPQLLKLAGFKSFWFCRGIPSDAAPSEFHWKGIDGTTVPSFCLPGFYGLFYGPPRDQAGFDKFFVDRYNFLNPNARGNERVGLAGVDVSEPEDYVAPLLRKFNAEPSAPFTIRYSTPTEFAKVVAKRKDAPTFDYDLNPIFPGTYSSRIELKQRAKQIETKLLDAEAVGAVAVAAGAKADANELWQAWEPLIFNQTHDLASGTMNDHVYVDTVKSYDFSDRLADEALQARSRALIARIDTRGSGAPIVVFNSLGWERSDLVRVELGFADGETRGVRVVDPGGKDLPVQAELVERYADGRLKRARIAFVAAGVPACGYATFRAIPVSEDNLVAAGSRSADSMQNEFYNLRIDPKTGALTSVIDKSDGSEALFGPANVVAQIPDHGDLWELYRSLDGASHLPTLTRQPVPTSKTALLSTDGAWQDAKLEVGPVYSEYVASRKFGSGTLETRVRLTRGVRRIDFETTIVNGDKHVRYQVLFPTALRDGRYVQGIPFGSVERQSGVEYAAQDWVDYGSAGAGVALLNQAMPGNLVSDAPSGSPATLALSLMRSANLGDYNGGDTSDTGFELGVARTLRYALVPHRSDWRKAGVARAGAEFNSPLLAFKSEAHSGPMPPSFEFVKFSAPNVVLTSLKPGPNGSTVLRFYESSGEATKLRLSFGRKVASAEETDLLGDRLAVATVSGSDLRLALHPFQIVTLRVNLHSR